MEQIVSSLEYLQIKDDNAPLQQCARERKLNPRYFNNETITNFWYSPKTQLQDKLKTLRPFFMDGVQLPQG